MPRTREAKTLIQLLLYNRTVTQTVPFVSCICKGGLQTSIQAHSQHARHMQQPSAHLPVPQLGWEDCAAKLCRSRFP